jgi:hypothetical protein
LTLFKEKEMKLTPPKTITFWIAIVLGVVGLLGVLLQLPFLTENGVYLVAVGFILLALGNLLKGL